MKNASAIKRKRIEQTVREGICARIGKDSVTPDKLIGAFYDAEIKNHADAIERLLAGYTEIGPCERGHLKMFWVAPELKDLTIKVTRGATSQASGSSWIDPPVAIGTLGYCKLCLEIEREVAGAYEAAAQVPYCRFCDEGLEHIAPCYRQQIRSLDSSAAQRGKQRIREEALAPVKQLAEKWLRWAGKPTQEAVGCGNTDDERNEAANDAYRDAANSLLTLIDKPGGR